MYNDSIGIVGKGTRERKKLVYQFKYSYVMIFTHTFHYKQQSYIWLPLEKHRSSISELWHQNLSTTVRSFVAFSGGAAMLYSCVKLLWYKQFMEYLDFKNSSESHQYWH